MSEQNKKTIRIVREKAPADLSLLDGLYTDGYVYHGIPLLGDMKGLTHSRHSSAASSAQFPIFEKRWSIRSPKATRS